ncbi:MAG: hypothetical protein ACRD8O_09125 [Bryobacteraceae bacterium]
MEFEQFKDFMLQSAAEHDARIAMIEDSLNRLSRTTQVLVDNQIHLQESLDRLAEENRRASEENRRAAEENRGAAEENRAGLAELRRIVFRHVTDPDAHKQ